MNNLSLTAAELERLVTVLIYFGLAMFCIFATLGIFVFEVPLRSAAWRAVSPAVLVTIFFFGFFVRTAWRFPKVADWMRRPLVHGVWAGTLTSDFKHPGQTGERG